MLNFQQVLIPQLVQTGYEISEFQTPYQEPCFTLPTQEDLPSEDGFPLEEEMCRIQAELLIQTLNLWLVSHGDGYVSGKRFLYGEGVQVRGRYFGCPDVFVVLGASRQPRDDSWVAWQEGKGPAVVIELVSEEITKYDQGKRKQIYQDYLKVAEYFRFDPEDADDWVGLQLVAGRQYQEMAVDAQNRLPSAALGLTLGRWQGVYHGYERIWLRWATPDGNWLPTEEEAAKAAERVARYEAEHRAAIAEAEIARLTALLAPKPE
jgi:Uma2 family endonuclease